MATKTRYKAAYCHGQKFNQKRDRMTMFRRLFLSGSLAVAALSVGKCLADAPLAPVIYAQPQSRTVRANTSVTFKVEADGYPSLNYRWRKNGTSLDASNSSTLTLLSSISNSANFDVVI